MRRVAVVLFAAIVLSVAWPQMPLSSAAPSVVGSTMSSAAANKGGRAPIVFNLVGASWTEKKIDEIEFRTSVDGSTWSPWKALEIEGGSGPDAGEEGARAKPGKFTSLAWVGEARFIQTRGLPAGKLHLINVLGTADDPGAVTSSLRSLSRWARGSAQAEAAGAGPIGIYTRRQWGADERIREQTMPGYASNAKMAVVHHTDTGNNYSSSQVPAILRGIYVYHVRSRGFRDIAYNFLVDRYGRMWEGRWGGMVRSVTGAHTAGFNYATVGVSMLGNFVSATPPTATLSAITRILTWKFTIHRIKPRAYTRYTVTKSSAGGMRWPPGTTVTLNTIVAHRDVNSTACPGAAGYRTLNWIRGHTWNKLPPAGAWVSDGTTVWQLGPTGRYPAPDPSVWRSNVPAAELLRRSPYELLSYPVGGPAWYREGTLVRGIRPPDPTPAPTATPSVDPSASPLPSESPTASPSPSAPPTAVTYMFSGGRLRPFQNDADVIAMGFKLSRVIDVPGSVLAKYKVGAAIDPAVYPDGTVIRASGATVSYVIRGGKRWALLPEVFPSYAYTTDDVVTVSLNALNAIPFAGHRMFRDGTLMQSSGSNKTIYVISGGKRRPIASSFVFKLLGYYGSNVRVVRDGIVTMHPLGAVVDGRGP